MKADSSSGWATANSLAVATGAGAHHVRAWLKKDGVPFRLSGGRQLFERSRAEASIRVHQKPLARKAGAGDRGLAALASCVSVATRERDVARGELELLRARVALVLELAAEQFTPEQIAWLASQLTPTN